MKSATLGNAVSHADVEPPSSHDPSGGDGGPSPRVQAARELLSSWLSQDPPNTATLLQWLQGLDWPLFLEGEEPYLWLLRALPEGWANVEARAPLARQVAVLLDQQPDVHRPGRLPDRALYNLFQLATVLARPQELADSLERAYYRNALAGHDFEGLDLRIALRGAMIENQLDRRFEKVWMSLIRQDGQALVPGTEEVGFEGIGNMPASGEELDTPCYEALGAGCDLLAQRLEAQPECRSLLRDFLAWIKRRFLGGPPFDQDLVHAFDILRVQRLPVVCLPSLLTRVSGAAPRARYLAWEYLVWFVPPSYGVVKHRSLCGGRVLDISVDHRTEDWLLSIAGFLEQDRKQNPFRSEVADLGAILERIPCLRRAAPDAEALATVEGVASDLYAEIAASYRGAAELNRAAGNSPWPTDPPTRPSMGNL